MPGSLAFLREGSLLIALCLAMAGCKHKAGGASTQVVPPETPSLVKSEFIFETAPFPACHASTIAESKSGLIAAWFGGKHEKSPDVGIWISQHSAGKWTPPREVATGVTTTPDGSSKRFPCWNPVL